MLDAQFPILLSLTFYIKHFSMSTGCRQHKGRGKSHVCLMTAVSLGPSMSVMFKNIVENNCNNSKIFIRFRHHNVSSNYILTQAYAAGISINHILLQMSKLRPGEKSFAQGHASVLYPCMNTSLHVHFLTWHIFFFLSFSGFNRGLRGQFCLPETKFSICRCCFGLVCFFSHIFHLWRRSVLPHAVPGGLSWNLLPAFGQSHLTSLSQPGSRTALGPSLLGACCSLPCTRLHLPVCPPVHSDSRVFHYTHSLSSRTSLG